MVMSIFSFYDGIAALDCTLHSLLRALAEMKRHITSVKTEKFKEKVKSS